MRTTSKIVLFSLVFLTGILILTLYLALIKPRPDYTGTVRIEGLDEAVAIHRNEYGVPKIQAMSQKDLFFAVGYVHAQDRRWQMMLSQMAAEGRFAEFLGPDLVPFDQYQRTLGFWRVAGEIEAAMPDSLTDMLGWYADGVNAWTAANEGRLPLEFSLARIRPVEWTPRHSIALSRLMAWEQNINWWSELTLAHLATRLPAARMRELVPDYADTRPITGQQAFLLGKMLDTEWALREASGARGTSIGSNAWVAAGSKTSTGKALLAGDPHMGLSMPGNWFEAVLSAPGFDVAGAMIPGSPFMILGQNGQVAWSLTNIMADDTDFFLERQLPGDSLSVVVEETRDSIRTEPITILRERIRVKGEMDRILTIRFTSNGPIINDIHPAKELTEAGLISMSWTGHTPSQELGALYDMNRATSVEEFRLAASRFKSPGMNAMVADSAGSIAMFAMAGLPVRTTPSVFFRHGWVPEERWGARIPFEQLPSVVNPAKGWIANANNKIHDDRYPFYLATFWEPSSRIERLVELFESTPVVSADDVARWQSDVTSPHARELLDIILPVLIDARQADSLTFATPVEYLLNWDYGYDLTSSAASLMDVFHTTLVRNTLLDDLGPAVYEQFVRLENLPVRSMIRLLRLDSPLFDDSTTPEVESRDQMIIISMRDAIGELERRFGPRGQSWRWENLHTLTLEPPLFAQAAADPDAPWPLRLIVRNLMSSGPHPVPGHGMTLNNGQYDWNDPYSQVLGASIRRIVDFSQPRRMRSVIPTGQSGNPMSPYFGDQTKLWLDGAHKIIDMDGSWDSRRDVKIQTLMPKKGRS